MTRLGLAVVLLAAPVALAQPVISARSGAIHYTEGQVRIGDRVLESKPGYIRELKENEVLTTEAGRTELLLTPGVFLRVAEASSIRMVSSALTDTQLEILAGTILVEATDLPKDNSVRILFSGTPVHLRKEGLYRFDTEPLRLRVYEGEAAVAVEQGGVVKVKKGREYRPGVVELAKFDAKSGDGLQRWSRRRAEYIALANLSMARSLSGSRGQWESNWRWNPWFGMFTYVPMASFRTSPYGYRYWSPATVRRAYIPQPQRRVASARSTQRGATGERGGARWTGRSQAGSGGAAAQGGRVSGGRPGGRSPGRRGGR